MAFPVAVISQILVPVLVEGVKAALDRGLSPKQAAQEATNKAISNPAVRNQMNAEAPYQSRVVTGAAMAATPALFYCLYALFDYGFDWGAYIDDPTLRLAVPAAAGAVYALYGRLWPGLKPLFSRG